MFPELEKYDQTDHFIFRPQDKLRNVCNAPTHQSGVYIIYGNREKTKELVYIGSSGHLLEDGTMFVRPSGLGGIKGRMVNGKSGGISRQRYWSNQMKLENIDALHITWYVTHCEKYCDCPEKLEGDLIKKYQPRWNIKGK